MSAVSRIVLPVGAALPAETLLLRKAKEQQQKRGGDATLKLTQSLLTGDLWADGQGWGGPFPAAQPGNSVDRTTVTAEIERTFVSRNLARDIVRRHRSGVAGREPLWTVLPRRPLKKGQKPTGEEQIRIEQYSGALTDWWDDSGAWLAVQKALDTALALGHGTVRLYIHADSTLAITDDQGIEQRMIPAGLSLSEAARRISIHAPAWDQAGVTRDLDGHVTGAYFTRQEEQGKTRWELQERVKANGQTSTRVHPFIGDGGTDLEPPVDYPVPDLLIYEIRLDPLITDSVRRLLKMANKTLTMGSRNVDLGGFLERTILNGQMPGGYQTMQDGSKVFVPGKYNVGAGVTNFLTGHSLYAKNSETGALEPSGQFATPSIVYKDPTAFTVFSEAFEKAREMILDEANQLHVLITGDASASGVSRQQAVNDFISSLEPTRMALEQLVRWLLNTVLQMALHFTGRREEAEEFRVTAQARLSAVQPTPAEIDVALKLRKAGVISRESLYARVGIDDEAAESAALASEGITLDLVEMISNAGAPEWVVLKALMLALPALGISEADVAAQRDMDLAAPIPPTDLMAEDPAQP
ncbi:hypothetical protein [Deinococcus humi]|uniref:Portal protein n=1 Tax=Deinococcus humi TaxID=662880 RepID=A0A7W8JVJ7_9DEIO|nr:hypothetical protein [Deinococcus humi]MBB5364011.1 hypothetical protein [Deinococcus humi]GGO32669.1 hypothetical protein GCM10008949_30570 [Deinococcus humi]